MDIALVITRANRPVGYGLSYFSDYLVSVIHGSLLVYSIYIHTRSHDCAYWTSPGRALGWLVLRLLVQFA